MSKHYYFILFCANQLALRFNLEMTALGLKNEERFILTDNNTILDFLRIDREAVSKIKTDEEAFKIIEECKYFNPSVFKATKMGVNTIKPLPTELKTLVIKFVKHVRESKPECKYKFTRYKEVYNKVIDNFIARYNLTNSVIAHTELKKRLSDKLNGSLVMEWLPGVKPGPYLGDMMKQFKEDIETKCPYDVYLFKNDKETIKNDFILFFTV